MERNTVIIDGFDGLDVNKGDINSVKDESQDFLIMAKDDDTASNLETDLNITYISCSSRLGAFYKVKSRIDEKKSSELTLYSSLEKGDFWETVCSALLTPAYKWIVKISDSSYRPKYDKEFLPDIQSFLTLYKTEDDVCILKSDLINPSLFYHGFSTRKGGLSTAPGVASLNITPASIKRDSDIIGKENIRRLAGKGGFDPGSFTRARAVHGNTVYVVGNDEPNNGYDCVISNKRNITVAAPGADCVMMLFADPVSQAYGACHSGWKGTVAKACIETIKKMEEEFGTTVENIQVVLGPNIRSCCLEFDEKEANLFTSINEKCVIRKEGYNKPHIDLCLANRTLLESIGVLPSNIDDTTVTLCTACHPELLFSYRRDHIPFGNQVGFIGLR